MKGHKAVKFKAAGLIGPLAMRPNKPLQLEVSLESAGKIAIEVAAYEA
ncbi:MAG: hypothetical protein J0M17_08270 [Planctomycetes bacterium]|nr:hypothetical protein [Planctomycetota bacterium]